jgi:hypothetical protein
MNTGEPFAEKIDLRASNPATSDNLAARAGGLKSH